MKLATGLLLSIFIFGLLSPTPGLTQDSALPEETQIALANKLDEYLAQEGWIRDYDLADQAFAAWDFMEGDELAGRLTLLNAWASTVHRSLPEALKDQGADDVQTDFYVETEAFRDLGFFVRLTPDGSYSYSQQVGLALTNQAQVILVATIKSGAEWPEALKAEVLRRGERINRAVAAFLNVRLYKHLSGEGRQIFLDYFGTQIDLQVPELNVADLDLPPHLLIGWKSSTKPQAQKVHVELRPARFELDRLIENELIWHEAGDAEVKIDEVTHNRAEDDLIGKSVTWDEETSDMQRMHHRLYLYPAGPFSLIVHATESITGKAKPDPSWWGQVNEFLDSIKIMQTPK